MLREADWVMNETPTPEKLDAVRRMVGPHATLIQCLSGGGGYDAAKLLNNPRYGDVGMYGFAPQPDPRTTLPPDSPQEAWQKVLHANIETLRKAYHGAEYTVGETPDRITIATPQLEAAICKGYVSGVAAQSFRDKMTGFRDFERMLESRPRNVLSTITRLRGRCRAVATARRIGHHHRRIRRGFDEIRAGVLSLTYGPVQFLGTPGHNRNARHPQRTEKLLDEIAGPAVHGTV